MTMDEIRIVYEGGSGEIEEKKSRFIANIVPVHTEEEALSYIAATKKRFWDARHNCFAYILGERGQNKRCSDDGEPQGTAGRPMLDVLEGEHLTDVVCVVTRYFGGTLLGTGGLVRAYGAAVRAGLAACRILTRKQGVKLTLQTDYTDLGKIQYILGQRQITVLDSSYADAVSLTVVAETDACASLKEALREATSARIVFADEEPVVFAEGGSGGQDTGTVLLS